MSDEQSGNPSDQTPPPGNQPPPPPGYGHQPPNWGNAYPPPPQYPPGYGQAYPQFVPQPPKHSQATTAMVLGIISLAGVVTCFVPILLAPVAWILGAKAVKEIDANPMAYSGRSEAVAGKIMGIIGTVLLILALIALAAFIVMAVTIDGFWDDDSYDDTYYSMIGWLGQVVSVT